MAMVGNVTSLTGNGLRDWLIQRVTALVIAAYAIFLMVYIIMHSPLNYVEWSHLFQLTSVQVFSFLALLSIVMHAWIGLWTVFTDYIKCACLRLPIQVLVIITLLSFLVWGAVILWGN